MLVLADLCPCFHQSPTNLCLDRVSFTCWIVIEFWSITRKSGLGYSHSKLCPILRRLRTKLCPNFSCSRARLCPISFAPCPFPNLAGTLINIDQCIKPSSMPRHAHNSYYVNTLGRVGLLISTTHG